MKNPEYLVIASGGLAFVSGFADTGGFPPNGYEVLAATGTLTVLVSMVPDGPAKPVVTGLAALMLLGAAIAYIPGLAAPKPLPTATPPKTKPPKKAAK